MEASNVNANTPNPAPYKLFIGGLSYETTRDSLYKYFEPYGGITDCAVMFDKFTKPRGFGFITFATDEIATNVLRDSPHNVDGRQVDVKRAEPMGAANNSNVGGPSDRNDAPQQDYNSGGAAFETSKIFVGGLAPQVTEESFQQYFEQFGKVVEVLLLYDRMTNNRHRGFGFITFDDPACVDTVISRKSDHIIEGKWVEVKRAQQRGSNARGSSGGGGGGGPPQGRYNYDDRFHQGGGYRPPPSNYGDSYGSQNYGPPAGTNYPPNTYQQQSHPSSNYGQYNSYGYNSYPYPSSPYGASSYGQGRDSGYYNSAGYNSGPTNGYQGGSGSGGQTGGGGGASSSGANSAGQTGGGYSAGYGSSTSAQYGTVNDMNAHYGSYGSYDVGGYGPERVNYGSSAQPRPAPY
eukprot:Platyproteum_vivax@DN14146_c0_g1_i1.p1